MFRTFSRTRAASALSLSAVLVMGCDDDDDDDNGRRDAGVDDGRDAGGRADAGRDAAAPLSCGEGDAEVSCQSAQILSATLAACCVQDTARCGLDLAPLDEVTQGLFAGCVETNQPTAPPTKEVSQTCTSVWEAVDDSFVTGDAGTAAGDAGTGDAGAVDGFTFTVAGQTVSFQGCCRLNENQEGECGFLANEVLGSELGFGCLPLSQFRNAFQSQAQFDQVRAIAVCDPTTGEAIMGDAGLPEGGLPEGGVTDAGADGG